MRFLAPADTSTLNIAGTEYNTDANGYVECAEEAHFSTLRSHGYMSDEDVAAAAPVVADTPPALPEGIDEEFVRALVEENEGMKAEIASLRAAASGQNTVEDQLRDRIQELEGLLEVARAAPEATETATGAQESTAGASEAGEGDEDAPDASEEAESPIKEVGGVLVEDAEAFDGMEYNLLKEWAKAHGVALAANVRKPDAIAACKARFAELTAPAAE